MPELEKQPQKRARADHSDLLIAPKEFAKISVHNIQLSHGWAGEIHYIGNAWMELTGNFGPAGVWTPLLSWDLNPAKYAGRPVSLWPEFCVDGNIRLELHVALGEWEHGGRLIAERAYPLGAYRAPLFFNDGETDGYLSLSLYAYGEGTLRIGTLHCRQQITPEGTIVAGDQRFADSMGGEVFCYYHPGDGKAPLVVHFCDFGRQENFKDAALFEYFNVPYLIFTDPRVFDGAFYIGTPEYERFIQDQIQMARTALDLRSERLLFSGYGMGAYAAVHYGIPQHPDTILMTQPVMNIARCAGDEREIRPGRFPGAMDILRYLETMPGSPSAEDINERIWREIDGADLRRTDFAIAYMKEDDYDPTAYTDLVDHMATKNNMVYGKGITGRHGDDPKAVRNWYYQQFVQILREEFQRGAAPM